MQKKQNKHVKKLSLPLLDYYKMQNFIFQKY